ncbi:hypothetical protein FF1_032805 [Malus domestica]
MDDTLDAAFWLPTQILNDDDAPAMELNSKTKKSGGYGFDTDAPKALFPFEFPYGGAFGVSSDFSSPVESSETESDEEDYLVGLTRQMARSTLDDEFKYSDSAFAFEKPKGWVATGSPQSTLCAVGSGCGCGQGSSRGSPNAQSPPATWDLLHAAAGEVAKMRINQSRGLLGPPRKPSPVSVPTNNHPDAAYYYHQQSLSHKHLRAAQFELLRQQQMMKEQNAAVWGAQTRYPPAQTQLQHHLNHQTRARNNTPNILNARPLGLSPSAWPRLQQAQRQQQYNKNGFGFRAVYLGNQNPSAKVDRSGTGVFLPRQVGPQFEPRKKQVCSTALLPARVVQALNLNIDDMQQQPQLQRRFNGRLNSDYEVALQLRSKAAATRTATLQQKRNIWPQPAASNEIRLPQEWTY